MVAPKSDEPMVITITGDVREQILAAAARQRRSASEIVLEACKRLLATLESQSLDEQYEQGYRRVPEDTRDVEALLPHLPLPPEDWT